MVQPLHLFYRFVLARFVVSQQKLNELWDPPPMLLGDLYASCLKTVALCLIYAPLWPMAYLLTALAIPIDDRRERAKDLFKRNLSDVKARTRRSRYHIRSSVGGGHMR